MNYRLDIVALLGRTSELLSRLEAHTDTWAARTESRIGRRVWRILLDLEADIRNCQRYLVDVLADLDVAPQESEDEGESE